jgi:hypothetical protein
MKKSRFTEEQIIAALKEADAGRKVSEITRKMGRERGDVLPLEGQVRRDDSPTFDRGPEGAGALKCAPCTLTVPVPQESAGNVPKCRLSEERG